MSYSNYQLNQRINNLQQQISNLDVSVPLQTVLNDGNSAIGSIELTSATDGNILLEYNKLSFVKDANTSTIEYDGTTNSLTIDTTTLNLNGGVIFQQGIDMQGEDIINCATMNCEELEVNEVVSDITFNNEVSFINQVTFDTPPQSTTPLLGNDLTTKGYVDSLVGQYSGGYNLYLNYSETLVVNSITYNYLSNQVSDATQQDLVITTDGTEQLLATFISDELNISVIPAGLWNMVLYGSVSGAGGVLYYFFKLKRYNLGTITDIATSGNSPDVNATPTGNPDAYHMNATIDTPINISLTDRVIIEIYCIKFSGVNVQLNTYFEGAYYSYIQSTLNAGTTLLTSDNNWTGNNNFAITPTTITTTAGSNNTQITTTAYIYNELLSYLTTATASSTYLTIANALSTYLTIATASLTYLTIANASSTYLTIANAVSTYAPKASPTFTGVLTSASIVNSGSIEANIFKNSDESFKTNGSGKITGTELVLGTGTITSCGSITSSSEIGASSFKNTDNNFSASSAGAINCVSLSATGTATATTLSANTIDSAGTATGGGNVSIVATPTTRVINIAGGQTTGNLFIGAGARSTANSGTINFGNNTGAKNNIYIGNGSVGASVQTQTYGQGTWTFSNAPLSVTPTSGDNSLKLSTTEYVQTALGSYLTTALASTTYATIASLSSYLTTATASATYLTIATASSTYATIASLSNYLTTATASATYLTIATASSTYLTIANALSTYAPLSNPTIVNSLTLGSGDFDVLSGFIRSSGNISSTSGALIAGTIRNTNNNGSISSAGVITGTQLILGSGAVGCGAITGTSTISASGLITANGGLTVPSGDVLTTDVGVLSGRLSYVEFPITSLPATLSMATVNIDFTVLFYGEVGTTSAYTIPSDIPDNQRITFKNWTTTTTPITINFTTYLLYQYGINNGTTGVGVSSISLAMGDSIVIQRVSAKLYEILSASKFHFGITLPTLSVIPSSSQLGYTTNNNLGSTSVSSVSTQLASLSTIPIGIYLLIVSVATNTWSAPASGRLTLTVSTTNGTSNISILGSLGPSANTNASGGFNTGTFTGQLQITATSGTVSLTALTLNGTVNVLSNIRIIRIA